MLSATERCGNKRAFLRHVADAARLRRFVAGGAGQQFAAHADLAAIRLLEAGDQAQQCGLAAAGAAEDGDQAAGFDREADVPQHRRGAEAFPQDGDLQAGHHAALSAANTLAAPKRRASSQEAASDISAITAA